MKALLCALLAVVAAACGPAPLTSGDVVSKRYEPRREWLLSIPQFRTQCTGTGSSTICIQVFSHMLYLPQVDDEDWYITVSGCDEKTCRESEVQVTRDEYESLAIGDHWQAEA